MWWKDYRLRLRALFFRRRMDEELQEELQLHIDMQARKNQRHESDAAEATRQARLQFGSLVRATEECKSPWQIPQAWTRISNSPGPGEGRGRLSIWRSPLGCRIQTAFMDLLDRART
jgi:hypothetical protein